MALPQFTLSELMTAGVHFGHRTFRWNPEMKPFIYGERNGIHIIDLQQTVPMMYRALSTLRGITADGGRILFVGTKNQNKDAVKDAAERCGMYYINHRWLGGMLTNWRTIQASVTRLKQLEADFAADAEARTAHEEAVAKLKEGDAEPRFQSPIAHLTKKERLMRQRDMEKLQQVMGGIKTMAGLPQAMIVLDVKKDAIAVAEARHLGIPVFGIVDTNSSLEGVTHPIPGNDDASRAAKLYAGLFADAILDGIAQQATRNVGRPAAAPTPMKAASASTTKAATGKGAEVAGQQEAKVTLSKAAQEASEKAEIEAKAKAAAKKAEAAAASA